VSAFIYARCIERRLLCTVSLIKQCTKILDEQQNMFSCCLWNDSLANSTYRTGISRFAGECRLDKLPFSSRLIILICWQFDRFAGDCFANFADHNFSRACQRCRRNTRADSPWLENDHRGCLGSWRRTFLRCCTGQFGWCSTVDVTLTGWCRWSPVTVVGFWLAECRRKLSLPDRPALCGFFNASASCGVAGALGSCCLRCWFSYIKNILDLNT